MNKQELLHTTAAEVAKGAPPASVAIYAHVNSWTMADVVTVLTIIYLLLNIGLLLWKHFGPAKPDKAAKPAGDPDHG